MTPRENIDRLSKPFAHRLSAMMEAGLLRYREYAPWADAVIAHMPEPPRWLLDLTVTKYRGDAIKIVKGFAHSEPFEHLSIDDWVDEQVGALYLRYERRELSWATFLDMAGQTADANGGRNECEYFFMMLNEFEEADFAEDVESKQRGIITNEYADVIASVRQTFEYIKKFREGGMAWKRGN